MLVSELFTRLSYGPFSNLSLGMDGNGSIATDKKPQIVGHINEALLKLYSKFVLKENDLILEMSGGIRNYRMTSANAASNLTPAPNSTLYIRDTTERPFRNDVIRILEVRDRYGLELPLNDIEHPCSVFTPQPDVLQVPSPMTGELLGVLYQARHPYIALDNYTAEIDIPSTLESALVSYIAYLTYTNMNTQESTAKAAEHMSVYLQTCEEIDQKDLVSNSYSQSNTRFSKRGWI